MGLARLRLSTRLMEQLLGFPEGYTIESWGVGTDIVEVRVTGPSLPDARVDGSLVLVNGEVTKTDPCDVCGHYDNVKLRFVW